MKDSRLLKLFDVTFLVMELSYLYIFANILNEPVYITMLILLLYLVPFLSRHSSFLSSINYQIKFVLEMALIVLVILIVVGERLLASLAAGQLDVAGIILRIFVCGLIWWWGNTVPREDIDYPQLCFRFQAGALVVLVFSQISGNVPVVLLFFMMALITLLLARWTISNSKGLSVLRNPGTGYLLLAGAGVTVPAAALFLLLSPDVARAVVNWLSNILTNFSNWAAAQQKPVSGPPINFEFPFSCKMQPEEGGQLPTPAPVPTDGGGEVSPVVIALIISAVFLVILTIIAFALRKERALRKVQIQKPVPFQLRVVSLRGLRNTLVLLPQLFKKLWAWIASLFRIWKKRPKPSEETVISVRAVYRNLMQWAARQGAARLSWQTPLEHIVVLEKMFPQQENELKQIAGAYLLARYSRKPSPQGEFDRIKKALQRVMAYRKR